MIRTKEDGKGKFSRANKEYSGKLSEYQISGSSYNGKKYSHYEKDPYNDYQNFLYSRALSGIRIYTQEQLAVMGPDKKRRIVKVHRRAQKVLNLWKQKIVNDLCNHLFRTLFSDSCEKQGLINHETDEGYINTIPFKHLKITKTQIIERFIIEGILPHNFNELKT